MGDGRSLEDGSPNLEAVALKLQVEGSKDGD